MLTPALRTLLPTSVFASGDFNGSSAYLNRTPSAGDRTRWSYSFWAKQTGVGAGSRDMLCAQSDSNNFTECRWNNSAGDGKFKLVVVAGGADVVGVETTNAFTRTDMFYHVLFAYDSNQSTAADRVKIYINGKQETLTTSIGFPSSGYQTLISSNTAHNIGRRPTDADRFFSGKLALPLFIDGLALAPSAVWQDGLPKKYRGPVSAFSWQLSFNMSGGLGIDTFGLGNWTNNLVAQSYDIPPF